MPRGARPQPLRGALARARSCLSSTGTARADEAAAWAALRQGGVVALMRHGDAPGVGDPPGWRLDDCATQRNLSERRPRRSARGGARLRAERIAIARVVSSPWCRCLDTAKLVDVGPVQVEPTFANAFILRDRREALREGGRAVIAAWRGPGVLLVVTHGENIHALTGRTPGDRGSRRRRGTAPTARCARSARWPPPARR